MNNVSDIINHVKSQGGLGEHMDKAYGNEPY
jgi:hypothetical protein